VDGGRELKTFGVQQVAPEKGSADLRHRAKLLAPPSPAGQNPLSAGTRRRRANLIPDRDPSGAAPRPPSSPNGRSPACAQCCASSSGCASTMSGNCSSRTAAMGWLRSPRALSIPVFDASRQRTLASQPRLLLNRDRRSNRPHRYSPSRGSGT
jgi:hypothetical protein